MHNDEFPHPLCWIRGLWRSFFTYIRTGWFMSGCNLRMVEEDIEASVSILKCDTCKRYDVMYQRKDGE